jgi:hypothetical protein
MHQLATAGYQLHAAILKQQAWLRPGNHSGVKKTSL